LRNLPEDIEELSEYYLNQMNRKYRSKFTGFTKRAKEAMMNHPWSGNVRELIHRIERAVIMGTGQYLDEDDIGLASPKVMKIKALSESKDELYRECIFQALLRNSWNITHSAKELDITQKSLRRLMKKLNIVKPTKN
jgi:two-component system NtrC family response regulator